jgi:hypothetical protein
MNLLIIGLLLGGAGFVAVLLLAIAAAFRSRGGWKRPGADSPAGSFRDSSDPVSAIPPFLWWQSSNDSGAAPASAENPSALDCPSSQSHYAPVDCGSASVDCSSSSVDCGSSSSSDCGGSFSGDCGGSSSGDCGGGN